jgi:hypothetical protein
VAHGVPHVVHGVPHVAHDVLGKAVSWYTIKNHDNTKCTKKSKGH